MGWSGVSRKQEVRLLDFSKVGTAKVVNIYVSLGLVSLV